MRTGKNDSDLHTGRVRQGRAVVVGLGLNDGDGHIRYTRSDAYELYGGSEDVHREMQRRALIIKDEMARLGISLDRMTYDQFVILQGIVNRVNCE